MRRFSVAVLVLIVLGFIMTVQREEPGSAVPVADTVTKKAAKQPSAARKEALAAPVVAEKPTAAEAKKAVSPPGTAESTAAGPDAAHEMAASEPLKPLEETAKALPPQQPADEERLTAGHLPSSATAATGAESAGTADPVSEDIGKAGPGRTAVDSLGYLPPWQRNNSPTADTGQDGADVKPKSKAKTSGDTKPQRVTRKAEPERARTVYRTDSTSSYGGWSNEGRRFRSRSGNCYVASDGVTECDRGQVYLRRR